MRVSRLLLVTLRDVPAEAELASHQLLLRAGYMRRVASGVYAYLPLLWRVLRRISAIIREEMDALGCQETLLPQLQPADLWERSGRWSAYTDGEGIMFHLRDRQDRCFGLGPTHEEVVTALVADLVRSYRQLPGAIYQIQTKFRDEIRPRFGLMRSREFIMKDGYSFHADETDLAGMYDRMDEAYRRIFRRCGLDVVAVEADSGAIGGAASREFMVTAEAGEDLVLTSGDGSYAANQERAVSLPEPAREIEAPPAGPRLVATPAQATIEELCGGQGLPASAVVKVLLLLARLSEGDPQPLLVTLRGDQQLNLVKLTNALGSRLGGSGGSVLEIVPIDPGQWTAQGLDPLPWGYLGPDLEDRLLAGARTWRTCFERFVDGSAADLNRFVCGANRADHHRFGVSWGDLPAMPEASDVRCALPGDRCRHDPSQRLAASRGIEVGHIFQLGRRYSQALDARFSNESGHQEAIWMGCYGIGVSRLAQAAVEQHHDDQGICWPPAIAPFEVIVVMANRRDPDQAGLAEDLYGRLLERGVDVLLDDRDERAGVKFKDADLIGIPWRVVVGRSAARGIVELVERRSRACLEIEAAALLPELLARMGRGQEGA